MIRQKFENQSFAEERGFTLIEILVVMAIIGMLAVIVAPNIFNSRLAPRLTPLFLKSQALRRLSIPID